MHAQKNTHANIVLEEESSFIKFVTRDKGYGLISVRERAKQSVMPGSKILTMDKTERDAAKSEKCLA